MSTSSTEMRKVSTADLVRTMVTAVAEQQFAKVRECLGQMIQCKTSDVESGELNTDGLGFNLPAVLSFGRQRKYACIFSEPAYEERETATPLKKLVHLSVFRYFIKVCDQKDRRVV
jgi:hypothetical protein